MSDEKFEYPDDAGYPDGTGTLDEGAGRDAVSAEAGGPTDERHGTPGGNDAEADAAEAELGEFALEDEEDVEGV
jgi:hypothetical protein